MVGGRGGRNGVEEQEVRSWGGGLQVKHISLQGKRSSFGRHSARLQVELQLFIIDVLP